MEQILTNLHVQQLICESAVSVGVLLTCLKIFAEVNREFGFLELERSSIAQER